MDYLKLNMMEEGDELKKPTGKVLLERILKSASLFTWFVCAIVGLAIGTMYIEDRKAAKSYENENVVKDTLSFQDSVLNFIFNLRLEHPYIVYAQALEESGRFTSVIFRENNNLFGMKMPEKRTTIAIGINKGHAVYGTWQDSVIDYALWQSSYMRGLSEIDYLIKLRNTYAKSVNYDERIKIIKESVKTKRDLIAWKK